MCRTCYITKDSYKSACSIRGLDLRSNERHREQCEQLSGPMSTHYSKTYGINRRSILLDIPGFSMFSGGLPHDIMHDLLEGVAGLEISLLLQHCVLSEKYFAD